MASSFEKLVEVNRKLGGLVADPHPGLFTWNAAVTKVLTEAADLLDAQTLRKIADTQERNG